MDTLLSPGLARRHLCDHDRSTNSPFAALQRFRQLFEVLLPFRRGAWQANLLALTYSTSSDLAANCITAFTIYRSKPVRRSIRSIGGGLSRGRSPGIPQSALHIAVCRSKPPHLLEPIYAPVDRMS